jgi:hypothetical protein
MGISNHLCIILDELAMFLEKMYKQSNWSCDNPHCVHLKGWCAYCILYYYELVYLSAMYISMTFHSKTTLWIAANIFVLYWMSLLYFE